MRRRLSMFATPPVLVCVLALTPSDPKGVTDAMSVKLTMYGTGAEQTINQASQQVLLTFVQQLYQDLMVQ